MFISCTILMLRIVVVLEKFVYVYNFEKLERIKKFDTVSNSKGIFILFNIEKV